MQLTVTTGHAGKNKSSSHIIFVSIQQNERFCDLTNTIDSANLSARTLSLESYDLVRNKKRWSTEFKDQFMHSHSRMKMRETIRLRRITQKRDSHRPCTKSDEVTRAQHAVVVVPLLSREKCSISMMYHHENCRCFKFLITHRVIIISSIQAKFEQSPQKKEKFITLEEERKKEVDP